MTIQQQTRSTEIRASSYDEAAGTVEIVYSTGAVVDRGGYLEELEISPEAIVTERLDAGAVHLIVDHMPYGMPIGRVVAHRIEDGVAIAVVKLSESAEMAGIVADIRAGVIRSVSVGYAVYDYADREEDGIKIRRAVKWMPAEISLTVLPADPGAQIRSAVDTLNIQKSGESRMDPEIENVTEAAAAVTEAVDALAAAAADTDADVDGLVDEIADAAEAIVEEVETAEEGTTDEADVTAERTRSAAIVALATRHGMPTNFAARHIAAGSNINQVRAAVLTAISARSANPMNARTTQRDQRDQLSARAAEALYARLAGRRAGNEAGDFGGLRVVDIARRALGNSTMMSDRAVIEAVGSLVQRSGMHTTSDFSFTSAIGGAVERRVREIGQNVEIPLMPVVRETLVSNFRPTETYSAGGFPALLETPEGGEYQAGTITSEGSTFSIRKYGRVLNLSFEALINDDLRLLDAAIRSAAVSGINLRNKVIRAAFDAKLSDGKALFHGTRGNLIAQALDVEGLSVARAALRKQKNVDGEPMSLSPKFLIVGPDLETDAQRLISPITAAVTGAVNPFSSSLTLIVDDMLTGDDWIIAADPLMGDAIELADLSGYEGVNVEEVINPLNDGISYRARAFAGAAATGWRGFVKSTGAA